MEKVILYQLFTRLFGNQNTTCQPHGTLSENGCGKMEDIDVKTLKRIRQLGATHIWFTGIIRHATQTDYTAYGIPRQHPAVVKGKAGSPYAIADYYDVDPDLAVNIDDRMNEFERLVDRTHRQGMKVVIDFVPNHVARQYCSVAKPDGVIDLGVGDVKGMHFSTRNNFYYCWGQPFQPSIDLYAGEKQPYMESPARATGNDCFSACPNVNDWYETVKLNYGVDYCDAGGRSEHFDPIPDTWNKMTEILLFWAAKGIDAFRCDMAEMVPTAFWSWAIDKVKYQYPHIKFIGEVYDPNQYRSYIAAGFDWLYDKVGMYDCVKAVMCRHCDAAQITRQWQATDDILEHMLYFLENHDEQRIASPQFAGDARKGIPALVTNVLMGRNPFMLYAGQEFGEPALDAEGFSGADGRTTIFDYWTVDSLRRGYFDRRKLTADEKALEKTYIKVLNMANAHEAVTDGLFYDLAYVNGSINQQVFPFIRKSDNETLLVLANFSDTDIEAPVVLPRHAFDYLQLAEGVFPAVDLLSGKKHVFALHADTPCALTVPANGAVVLQFILNSLQK